MSPLHVAIQTGNPRIVQSFINAGASLERLDDKDNCVFHYAARTSKDIIQDMKYGGTPLHWSCSREVINILINIGCHIDALNFVGCSALHMMVLRNRLECVVALLSHNAKVNIGDDEGDTALHIAVKQCAFAAVQALIVFGADLNARNMKGETPRHCVTSAIYGQRILYMQHSVGAPRCTLSMSGCSQGCSGSVNDHNGIPPPEPPSAESRQILHQMLSVVGMSVAARNKRDRTIGGRKILCLDGGGIRGLLLIQMLLELENATASPIVRCFDWLSGTSTGGILALGLASGKTLKECLCLHYRLKDTAFVGGRPYHCEPLETVLKNTLGTDTVMADIKHPKLLITGVLADRKPVALHLFRNYKSPSRLLKVQRMSTFKAPAEPHEQLLWKVGRATGVAPTYFRAFDRFLDGGLVANNPTLDTLTEIHEYNIALKACGRGHEVCPPTVVVSLGTGMIPVSQVRSETTE